MLRGWKLRVGGNYGVDVEWVEAERVDVEWLEVERV